MNFFDGFMRRIFLLAVLLVLMSATAVPAFAQDNGADPIIPVEVIDSADGGETAVVVVEKAAFTEFDYIIIGIFLVLIALIIGVMVFFRAEVQKVSDMFPAGTTELLQSLLQVVYVKSKEVTDSTPNTLDDRLRQMFGELTGLSDGVQQIEVPDGMSPSEALQRINEALNPPPPENMAVPRGAE